MKRLIPLLLALALLGGCAAPAAPTDAPQNSVTVILSPEAEPAAGFDPAFGWGTGEHVHEPLIQSTLTATNADLTVGYDLATATRVSADGLTWTVEIRRDAVFSDGVPLTAHDVAFTYNTVKQATSVSDLTMLNSAEAADDATVLFHMAQPFSMWPYTMAVVGIIPRHAYHSATYGAAPIGSGRYQLKQWDRGQQAIFEASPTYYGTAPTIRQLTVLFMQEPAALLAIQAGRADVAYTSATYAVQAPAGYSLLSVETVDNRGFNLPVTDSSVTGEVAVRQAINMGLSRETIIQNVLDGHGTQAYSVCDKLPWYSAAARVDYAPTAAAALLDAAGWAMGAEGVRYKNGAPLALTLCYPTGDSVRQALAAEVCNQLRALGFSADYEGVGWDTAYHRALSTPLLWGWGAHTPMELYHLYRTDPETGSARYSPYSNPAVDARMDEALACNDLAQSYTLWQAAQWDGETGVIGDVPWVWLVNINHLFWVRDGLTVAEQKIHPHGHGWSIVNNVNAWGWEA